MELRVLRYFLAVVREESISKAAESLHITQPTLSRQIMELEDELGVKLINRGRKNTKITLTEEGLLLHRRAEELIALADKTRAEIGLPDDTISGDIYIGGGETEAMRYIARAAKLLRDEFPQVRYRLFSGNADDVTSRLDKGLLDIGVFVGFTNLEKYNYIHLPTVDTWGLLMRNDHPLAVRDAIRIDDLKDIPLIVSQQSMVLNELSGWGGCDFNTLDIAATYNLVYNASLMVDEGVGCALCIDRLVDTASGNLCFRPLDPRLEIHLNVAWKKHQVLSKATKKFLEKLQDLIYF